MTTQAAVNTPAARHGGQPWRHRRGPVTHLVVDVVAPYRRWVLVVFVAMLFEIATSLAAPWPLKIVLDDALGRHQLPAWLAWAHDLGIGRSALGVAAFAGIATVLIAVVGAVAGYVDNYYTANLGQWIANDLRNWIYHHLQRLSLEYYDTTRSGALISTLMTDVSTVQSFASSSTLDIVVDLLTIVFMLVLMFWLDWDYTLIAIGVMPFLVYFVLRVNRLVKSITREVRQRQSEVLAVVQQGLGSMRAVNAYGRQDLEEERLAEASEATVYTALRARRVKSILSPGVAVVVALCTGLVLWKGTALVVAGGMTAGALTVYLAYLAKFFKPVKDLATMGTTIAQTSVAMERIKAILNTEAVIRERPDAVDPGPFKGAIAFEHVAFGYEGQPQVLRDVTFSIEPGQVVGIVGPTGGGKSTVLSLIPRFYEPASGVVRIDGRDIADMKLAALRAQIGFVLQETVLFRGTIRENIAYGRPDATDEEIVAAAKLANADEFIQRMPGRYDAVVGERGESLSGGQRQRIGIARALVRNSPIMILDEPTAALDTESEKLVIGGLERLMKGRTVVMVAHRLSTLRDADRIVVLKDGVVAEQGTHDELMARDGVFAELYRIQYEAATAAPPPPGGR